MIHSWTQEHKTSSVCNIKSLLKFILIKKSEHEALLKTWRRENKRTYWAIFLALVSVAAMTCLVEKKENIFFLENQVPEE